MIPDLELLARTLIVDAGVAPAAALAVGARYRGAWRFAVGAAGTLTRDGSAAAQPSTPFDLASITKPFVASAVARLARAGRLTWETPLGALVPELSESASGAVPLLLLVSHRAGLEAHRPLYAPLLGGGPVDVRAALRVAADARRADCVGPPPEEGFPPVYSDLGYLLAGVAASRAAGASLGRVVADEVTGPLGLDVADAEAWGARDPDFLSKVAPTEVVGWRGGLIAGQVHDENAWAVGGRTTCGHAGLFGTAASVARFGAATLDALHGRRDDWLAATEAARLVQPRAGGSLRAGFDGKSTEGSSAGREFGEGSFGHLGFTGTSLWCDPAAEVVAVILTNRVNPSRDNIAIRGARPALNDALFLAARSLSGG